MSDQVLGKSLKADGKTADALKILASQAKQPANNDNAQQPQKKLLMSKEEYNCILELLIKWFPKHFGLEKPIPMKLR